MQPLTWHEPFLAAGETPYHVQDLADLYEIEGIRAIVSLTERPLRSIGEITQQAIEQWGFAYLHAPVTDWHPPDMQTVNRVVGFIDQMHIQNKPVLLHCYAGVGRTGTLLHAYYLAKGKSLEQAKEFVKQKRFNSQFLNLSELQKAFLIQYAQSKSNSAGESNETKS